MRRCDRIHAGLLTHLADIMGAARMRQGHVHAGRLSAGYGFGEQPAFDALIAEVDGDFAGMCLFFPSFSTWRGRPGVYVQDLFVEERFRGAGVGVALLRGTAALSRARGGGLSPPVRRREELLGRSVSTSGSASPWSDARADPCGLWRGLRALAGAAESGVRGTSMKAFYADEQKRHDPKVFLSSGAPQPNPEKPERVERLLAGAKRRRLRDRAPARSRPKADRRHPYAGISRFPAEHLSRAGSGSRARRKK